MERHVIDSCAEKDSPFVCSCNEYADQAAIE